MLRQQGLECLCKCLVGFNSVHADGAALEAKRIRAHRMQIDCALFYCAGEVNLFAGFIDRGRGEAARAGQHSVTRAEHAAVGVIVTERDVGKAADHCGALGDRVVAVVAAQLTVQNTDVDLFRIDLRIQSDICLCRLECRAPDDSPAVIQLDRRENAVVKYRQAGWQGKRRIGTL